VVLEFPNCAGAPVIVPSRLLYERSFSSSTTGRGGSLAQLEHGPDVSCTGDVRYRRTGWPWSEQSSRHVLSGQGPRRCSAGGAITTGTLQFSTRPVISDKMDRLTSAGGRPACLKMSPFAVRRNLRSELGLCSGDLPDGGPRCSEFHNFEIEPDPLLHERTTRT
jgi:hypothetical protein